MSAGAALQQVSQGTERVGAGGEPRPERPVRWAGRPEARRGDDAARTRPQSQAGEEAEIGGVDLVGHADHVLRAGEHQRPLGVRLAMHEELRG